MGVAQLLERDPAAAAQDGATPIVPDAKLKQKVGRRQEQLRSEAQIGSIRSKETTP